MLTFDNSYARDLPGSYLRLNPDVAPAPRLLAFNRGLAAALGLDAALERDAAAWFSGDHSMAIRSRWQAHTPR